MLKQQEQQQHFEVVQHNHDKLDEKDEYEFNFLTFVEDEITPEDHIEYQYLLNQYTSGERQFLVETLRDESEILHYAWISES